MKKSSGVRSDISGKGLAIGIVAGRFNGAVTDKLLRAAETVLASKGVAKVETVRVPGAFEIPVMLRKMAARRPFDALIALGAVIRGGTPHFEYVCEGATYGVMKVMLETGVPVAFGVLTTDTIRQAMERSGGRHGNKGAEAALVAIEMARLVKRG
ncbi:MAG TPA: 6,7-dimethyl-8-ribityllumazine synthase [bacterium]|nr:6,7-dimethyl-8-ribityllumazine synthase [bacterium]